MFGHLKQYFPVVLCIVLYKVVLSFESMDGTLEFIYLNESGTDQYCHKGQYKLLPGLPSSGASSSSFLFHFFIFFGGGGGGERVGGGRSNQSTCLTVTHSSLLP